MTLELVLKQRENEERGGGGGEKGGGGGGGGGNSGEGGSSLRYLHRWYMVIVEWYHRCCQQAHGATCLVHGEAYGCPATNSTAVGSLSGLAATPSL